MYSVDTYLGFSLEYEEKKEELITLKQEYSALLEEYSELTDVVRKNLQTQYMMVLGCKEHAIFIKQIAILQCKREISLYQAAVNRGKKIDAAEVKKVIDKEFAEYEQKVAASLQVMKDAEEMFKARTLSPEEEKKIKEVFHALVMKLHPDLNPEQPPNAAVLWEKVLDAHKDGDWQMLFLLSDMADELLESEGESNTSATGTMSILLEQIEVLKKKREALHRTMEELQKRPPFTYKEFLYDPEKVMAKRKELSRQLKMLESVLKELREHLENLKQEAGNV